MASSNSTASLYQEYGILSFHIFIGPNVSQSYVAG
jgi:hypothetical protein